VTGGESGRASRLRLNRETLRTLTGGDLQIAAGGQPTLLCDITFTPTVVHQSCLCQPTPLFTPQCVSDLLCNTPTIRCQVSGNPCV
jgi:hypothetical protein